MKEKKGEEGTSGRSGGRNDGMSTQVKEGITKKEEGLAVKEIEIQGGM